MGTMKKLYSVVIACFLLGPEVVWGLDCVKFHNMAVDILKQEHNKVFLSWKASVSNDCQKMVSVKVQLKLVDEKEKYLGSSFKRLATLPANETLEIQGEKSLPAESYYKIHTYHFKAQKLSGIID